MSISVGCVDFSKEQAEKQGQDLYELVNREKDWLYEVFPGTVSRYEKLSSAIENVGRVATAEGIHAYIMYDDEQAIGIGTIIVDAVVEHPEEGIFRGNDIDYWIAPRSDDWKTKSKHNQAAAKLMFANRNIEHKRKKENRHIPYPPSAHPHAREGYGTDSIMGTIRVNALHPSVGLEFIMRPVGKPAPLTVPGGRDPFGLTKDDAELQLHTRNIVPVK